MLLPILVLIAVIMLSYYPAVYLVQAKRLNGVGYHFIVLGFKANQKKNSLLTFSTDGVASDFLLRYPKVKLLWEAYCKKELSLSHLESIPGQADPNR